MKLSDSKSARWTALLIVSITMMFGYFFTDVMSPLEPLLTAAKGAENGPDSDGIRMNTASLWSLRILQCVPPAPLLRWSYPR